MTTPLRKVQTMPLGVVLARRPGVTRWATHSWHAHAVLPGAGPANWRILREENDVTEFHAATLPLTLHRTEVEAYKIALSMTPPTVFVVLRPSEDPGDERDIYVEAVTASAYEAQDFLDSGNEQVEPVPMPEGLVAWVRDFVDLHFEEVPFIKRKRNKSRVDLSEDGIGDARVRQAADVYRAPGSVKPKGPVE